MPRSVTCDVELMLDSVASLFVQYGPLIFLVTLFFTNFGLPLAKSLVIVTAGVLAGRGSGHLYGLLLCCTLGLHLGDFAVFLLGRYLGKDSLRRRPLNRFIRPQYVDKAEVFIDRNGASSLLFARVTPFVRGPLYFLLGSLKMHPMMFTAINFPTSCVYSLVFFLIGYHLGNREEELLALVKSGNLVLAAVIVVIALILLRRHKRAKLTKVDQDPEA